jgi:RimJ/RimL family protein N-acetyltransferase
MIEITLHQATEADLDWIASQEQREDFATFIHTWSRADHRQNLSDPDMHYLIARDQDGRRLAFVILAGLRSPARSIELARIAVVEPGSGIGRPVLRQLCDIVFNELGANRFWLDVFEENHRARHVYETVGFRQEGILREAMLDRTGRLRSLVIMSILAREYQAGL